MRQWLGSVLLSLAAWRLGSVSGKRVERSVRLGMVVTLDEALRGAADHEVRGLAYPIVSYRIAFAVLLLL